MAAARGFAIALLAAAALFHVALAGCPFGHGSADAAAGASMIATDSARIARRSLGSYDQDAAAKVKISDVKKDLKKLFTTSQDFWPADFGHYGPLMIRLAWHCAGSYRSSDGRGGCDGGRIRFDPERSWPDNTNLDKARRLLWPVKQKYGDALSWGDLIVLAGDTAIESMGGPVLGFCGGRVDDTNGAASLPLGPSAEQEAVAPCPVNGECKSPLGASTVGLIYVNPEGPMAVPDPKLSAPQIREVFGRMGMNDSETVALIGGGHAFGKTHGACRTGPGPDPAQQPWNPWPGTCGSGPLKGKGPNTFTSGFEGPWTDNPIGWDNDYFKNLLEYGWESHTGPGGHVQWRPTKLNPADPEPLPHIMMLTTDVALLNDPDYLAIVKKYASDIGALNKAFSNAWYKLMTRDMGPVTRCLGDLVPPPQPFQAPLPRPSSRKVDYAGAAKLIRRALRSRSDAFPSDTVGGKPYYGALFATLAWQCAASFRETDYSGGCNGARIRFSPQKDWPQNKGMDGILEVLKPIRKEIKDLSYSDLIVLAGHVALEDAGLRGLDFCGGRVDASASEPPLSLPPPRTFDNKLVQLRDNAAVMGLTAREAVALQARPRSPSQQRRLGYSGSWSNDPSRINNDFFKVLLNNDWVNATSSSGQLEMQAVGKPGFYMTPTDLAIKWDAEYLAIAQEFASSNRAFLEAFVSGWRKMMNADRFDGPTKNVCYNKKK